MAEAETATDIARGELEKEAESALHSAGLGYIFRFLLGSTVAGGIFAVLVVALGKARSKMAIIAEAIERQRNGNDHRIHYFGQRILGSWDDKRINTFLKLAGGTIWVTHAAIDDNTALTNAVFFHPDPKFRPRSATLLRSMLPPVCTIEHPYGQNSRGEMTMGPITKPLRKRQF